MTTTKPRGSEPRAADTATPPRHDLPASRVRTYTAGVAVVVAAVSGAILGLPRPIALAVFAAGLLIAATAIRLDRGKS